MRLSALAQINNFLADVDESNTKRLIIVRPHCRTDNDVGSRLANRLWADRKPYDEALHLKQHTLRNQIH